MMGKAPLQLAGQRFGSLVALEWVRTNPNGRAVWYCRCDCGNRVEREGVYLKASGEARSNCGCLKSEMMRANGAGNRVHGITRSNKKLYDVWRQMIRRCHHSNSKDYRLYGARGIRVCPEWHDVVAFEKWALASGYREGLAIDRLDNDGGYSPDNCAWVSNLVNCNHTRKVRWVEAFGRHQSVSDWSRESGINYKTLMQRLNSGWKPERALSK